jgi:hypothetical protein
MDVFILRFMLAAYALAAFVISIFYLYYRRVTLGEYLFWGIVAFVIPIFGPFFVIAARPGPRKRLRYGERKSDRPSSGKPQASKG